MADLSQLMQIAPTTAAGFVGINQRQNEQMEQLRQAELAQLMQTRMAEESRKSSMHPFELDKMRLSNETTSAQLPGVRANSRSLGTKADIEEATKGSTIDNTNFKNQNEMVRSTIGQLGPFSEGLNSVPALGRHAELDSYLSRIGVPDAFKPKMMEHFKRFSGEQLPAELKRISDAMLRNTPGYAQTMDQEREQQKGATERTRIMAQNRVDVKGMGGGGSGKNPGNMFGDESELNQWLSTELNELRKRPPATQLTALNRILAILPEEHPSYSKVAAMAQEVAATVGSLPNAVPNPGAVDIGAQSRGGVAVNPPVKPHVAGGQPKPQSETGNQDLRARIAKAGWAYEPNKWDYRINPQTGKLERAMKE